MNDSERLHGKIVRLGDDIRVSADGWRPLCDGDPGAAIPDLLREIGETVLHRCLLVETDTRAAARIEVAGGRILALEIAEYRVTGGDGFPDMAGYAVALARALRDFVDGAAGLRIRTEKPGHQPAAGDLRCPVSRLAGLLGQGPSGRPVLLAFATALSGHVRAWHLHDPDGGAETHGPAGASAALTACLDGHRTALEDALDLALGGAGRAGCVMLAAPDGIGGRMIWARSGGARLLIHADATVQADLARCWDAARDG